VTDDRYGIAEHQKASLIYAYRFKLLKGQLAFGLSGGIDSYKINWRNVKTTDLEDPSFVGTTQKNTYAEAGFGIYYSSPGIYCGISAPTIYNQTFSMYRTVAFNFGGLINASENFKVKP